jgi:hypothetical protein
MEKQTDSQSTTLTSGCLTTIQRGPAGDPFDAKDINDINDINDIRRSIENQLGSILWDDQSDDEIVDQLNGLDWNCDESPSDEERAVFKHMMDEDRPLGDVAVAMRAGTEILLQRLSLVRQLLLVDPLPQNGISKYKRDPDVGSFVWTGKDRSPDRYEQTEDLIVPTWEISTNSTIKTFEGVTAEHLWYNVKRCQFRIAKAVGLQEDAEVMKVISIAVPLDHTIRTKVLSRKNLLEAMMTLDDHGYPAAKIVVPLCQFKNVIRKMVGFKDSTTREIVKRGTGAAYGRILDTDIHISTSLPDDVVFVLAPAEHVGVIPIRQSLTIIPHYGSTWRNLEMVAYEGVGAAVVNDIATAKIVIEP